MNEYNHYTEAKSIADILVDVGFKEQATAIRNAIDEGYSGTEIFMQLRFYLSPFKSESKLDKRTQNRIKFLLGKIEVALR